MRVTEIYASLQGESTHSGRPGVLVRFTGCSLRCAWCDTAYAFEGGEEISPDDVAGRIREFGIGLVLLTGGEPLEQEELPELIDILLDRGMEILVETGGAEPVGWLDRRVVKVLDFKCPASGCAGANRWENIEALGERDEVKFVIADRNDYDWAVEVLRNRLAGWGGVVLFSPVRGDLDPAVLGGWILEDRLPVRLQIQLHKVLWPDRERGV